MPRRRGIFSRVAGFLRGIVSPQESGEPEAVPSPEPQQPEPPRGPDVTETTHDRHMRQTFTRITGGSQDYQEWRNVYDPMSTNFIDESDPEGTARETEQYWDEFLRSFYLTSQERGSVPREQFYRDSGIPPRRVDWEEWRTLRRGTA